MIIKFFFMFITLIGWIVGTYFIRPLSNKNAISGYFLRRLRFTWLPKISKKGKFLPASINFLLNGHILRNYQKRFQFFPFILRGNNNGGSRRAKLSRRERKNIKHDDFNEALPCVHFLPDRNLPVIKRKSHKNGNNFLRLSHFAFNCSYKIIITQAWKMSYLRDCQQLIPLAPFFFFRHLRPSFKHVHIKPRTKP